VYACVHTINVQHVCMRPVQTFGKHTLPTLILKSTRKRPRNPKPQKRNPNAGQMFGKPTRPFPPLPKKMMIGNQASKVVEERQRMLSLSLSKISQNSEP
jgi:hypothetical protein